MYRKRYRIIANPAAGRGRGARALEAADRVLRTRGALFDIRMTTRPGHATELAAAACRDPGVDALVSLGGDGTLNEVVQAAVHTGKPVGVIPAGTGNDFARMLNTPSMLDRAIEVILAGKTRTIDAGRINERYFANNVGFGFDAAVNVNTRSLAWPAGGNAVYLLAFLRTLSTYRPVAMRVTVDGETIERPLFLVSVGNGTTCGGGFRLTPNAKFDDQLLDVTMIAPLGVPRLLWHLPKVFRGTICRTRHAATRRSASLTVESAGPLPVHVDGELYASPGGIHSLCVAPSALTVIGNFS